ncbi:MAG: L(+)-tartrate dehydratase subunit alpha [Clostridiales bacterium]|jgi:L(+)-tartrate dehydratase alpha subunit|nr:L(+)-tartrate dehydratase subunit alpha [Clostridiales bacterium]
MINEKLTEIIASLIYRSSVELPPDVMSALEGLAAREDSPLAAELYGCIFDNLKKAKELNRPICQDTGALQFFLKAGTKFPYLDDVEDSIREGVMRATERIPLRPNVVESFSERNTGGNVGTLSPWIEWEIVKNSSDLTVEVYMAGGGCSLAGRSKVLMPLEGYAGAVKFVFDTITEWGVNACPPLIVGIGIGACAPTAAMLSKKALLRPLGSENPNQKAAETEKRIKDGLNSIGIGPLGMSGKESVLGVNVEYAAHHPATLAVGLSVGCWATRRGKITVGADGKDGIEIKEC